MVGVALAAFATELVPRDDDAPEKRARLATPTTPPREATAQKTFNAEGYSFAYPGTWAKGRDHLTRAGRFTTAFAWEAPTAVSPSTSGEVLVVVAEPVKGPLVERGFDPFLRLMRKRLENEGERPLVAPTRVRVAGLPALRSAVEFPDGAVRRYTVILDRRRAYLLTCTFISKEMERGCNQVEESFRVG